VSAPCPREDKLATDRVGKGAHVIFVWRGMWARAFAQCAP
jgi:hypothetical protein